MSQISSATSPFAPPPVAGTGPDAERVGDAATVGDSFSALLAALFGHPMSAAPVTAPVTPVLPAGAASTEAPSDHASDDAPAEAGGGEWLPDGAGGQEEPRDGAPSPVPAAAANGTAGGPASAGNGVARSTAPQRGPPEPRRSLGAAERDTADPRQPADGYPIPAAASRENATPIAGERASAVAAVVPGERRAVGGRAAERIGTEAATGRGEAADRQAAAGTARPVAPVEQPLGASQIPVFGRLGLSWQVDVAERWENLPAPGLAGADGVAERAASATVEPAACATARPVQQLALAIGRMVKGELRQLTIQLSPRDLGTIEISLELDADRRLSVAILVERPETLDLLRQDARQLERLLGQQGLGLGDAGLELGLMGEQRRGSRERPSAETVDLALPDEAAGDADPGHAPAAWSPAAAPQRLNLSI
jgi:flagellar hook-length control protein FliK